MGTPAARICSTIDPPWTDLRPVLVGASTAQSTPDRYVLVGSEEEPLLRLDVYGEHHGFESATVWGEFVAVGFSASLHLVRLSERTTRTFELPSYFGSLLAHADHLLVASAEDLRAFTLVGELAWVSSQLGIDGVILDEIRDDTILGRGEWDPPGGWRPFRIRLGTGASLQTDAP